MNVSLVVQGLRTALRAFVCLVLVSGALSLAAPVSASAQTSASDAGVSAEQSAALTRTVEDFAAAMRKPDYEQVMRISLPPRLIASMVRAQGIDPSVATDAVLRASAKQTGELMKAVTMVSFTLDPATAQFFRLANGEAYAFIPTETVIRTPGAGEVKTVSKTLALMDGGKWYLVRVSDQQVPLLKSTYPQFANVTFESPVITRVGQ